MCCNFLHHPWLIFRCYITSGRIVINPREEETGHDWRNVTKNQLSWVMVYWLHTGWTLLVNIFLPWNHSHSLGLTRSCLVTCNPSWCLRFQRFTFLLFMCDNERCEFISPRPFAFCFRKCASDKSFSYSTLLLPFLSAISECMQVWR